MSADGVDLKRRRVLTAATSVVGAVGTGYAVYPFLAAWAPSEKAKAAGAPVEADISKLEPGQLVRVKWRGKPIWIVRRTEKNLADMESLNSKLADPESLVPQQPEYCKNASRSIKPEYLVAIGICTHLGCSPTYRPDVAPADLGADWVGGFFCPCHGSRFDLAGRVFAGVPAPTNLVIPPHQYLSDTRILVGVDGGGCLMSLMKWIDDRYPATKVWNEHLAQYYAPKNFNFWYFMGSLAMLVLVMQIVTGVWLAMSYKPDAELAFGSVEYIMRDVDWGWLIRYLHSTGASAFFVVIYLHMFRGLMYGSYRKPRELLWIIGVIVYLVMMATAFMGYLLPWGQMSYWGAQVIVNLFSAVPVVGEELGVWIRGDYVISDATLNRFFALHFLLPFILAALVFVHIVALHKVGSNNPDGVEIKKGPKGNRWSDTAPADGIPFHPYYSVKDIMGVAGFLFLFAAVVFFAPEMGGFFIEHPNFEPANPLKTPEHIAPVWYFTPFYAILRAVPSVAGSAFPGVIAMFASILIMFFLQWLDRSPVKSIRYKGMLFKIMLGLFVIDFIMLGFLGVKPTTDLYKLMAQIGTIYYFAFFLLMPIYSKLDRTKPVPERVTK